MSVGETDRSRRGATQRKRGVEAVLPQCMKVTQHILQLQDGSIGRILNWLNGLAVKVVTKRLAAGGSNPARSWLNQQLPSGDAPIPRSWYADITKKGVDEKHSIS